MSPQITLEIRNSSGNVLAQYPLDSAESPEDMNFPGWRLHALTGDLRGHYSVKVNANWRITFRLENGNAEIVDYQDYH